MEIVSLVSVFVIVAGLELAAAKKSATVSMELAIRPQKLAFARNTGEENAVMYHSATTAALKAAIACQAAFASAKKVGGAAAALKRFVTRPAKTVAAV